MLKRKKIKEETKEYDVREVYLQNRANMLEDFHSSLKEVQQEKPSVGGKIAGMDFQQFSLISIFRLIEEQREYAEGRFSSEKWIKCEEEIEILNDMITAAIKVFGKKEFNRLLKQHQEDDDDK